ncbi:MAG TPA: SLBB domain-containing protein [Armatimonadota bacterium]|nr:SLBB domain-containing protein [Armatimonadota bacterium]
MKAHWRWLTLAGILAVCVMAAPAGAEVATAAAPEPSQPARVTGPTTPVSSTSAAPAASEWVLPAPTSDGIPTPEAEAENLKLFGEGFFAGAPTNFTVAPDVPIPANYRLGKNDKLRIRFWAPAIAEETHEVTINKDGVVVIPGIGDVRAAGLSQDQFRQHLGQLLREQLKNVSFTADLIDTRSITVFVTGAAKRPGSYTVKAESNLFNVIYAAGGAAPEGSLRTVQLRRHNRTVATMDVYQFLTGGALGPDVMLEDQDVVVFPIAEARVTVGGEVARPAIYVVTEGTRVADVLALAGGMKASAYPRILRLRRIEEGRRVERTLDAQALSADRNHADNLLVRAGDMLTLENVTRQVRERVSIRGNVSFPGDYAIERVPTAKALLTLGHPRIGTYWQRADLTRVLPDGTPVIIPLPLKDILDEKTADVPLDEFDEIVVYLSDDKAIVPLATIEGAVKHPATYRVADGMRVSDLMFAAGGALQDASNTVAHLYRRVGPNDFKITRISPAEASTGAKGDTNPVLQDGDRLVIYHQNEVEYRYDKVQAVGELQKPGEYKTYEGMTLYDLILLAGGPTAQASGTVEVAVPVFDEKSNKRTDVKNFSLTDVMGGKAREEAITPGMLVSLPRREDKLTQPYKVELRGRFRRPGTYALLFEGEDLASLIQRAGGFTEDADPFGLSLTRTKEKMLSAATAEQVKTVMQTMDQLLPPLKSDQGNGSTTNLIDAQSNWNLPLLSNGNSGQKVLLVSPRRLTGMQSNNRIGFHLEDRQSYTSRLGKLSLCDGDLVEVPRLSDVVQVLGAVQSPGPVLFNASWSPARYINSAGGGAPDADPKRSVVIKVAGGVRPLSEAKTLDPGDVIVMASKHQIIQPPLQRGFRDVLYNILGVALVVRSLR